MESIQNDLNLIKELLRKQIIQQKEILTLIEVTEYLQISKSCLYKMTSRKEIPFYSPGGKKIYFRRTELDDWIFRKREVSSSELEKEVGYFINCNIRNKQ